MEKKPDSKYDSTKAIDNGAMASKNYIFNTLVKCEMDFQTFPFDQHTCNLEVYGAKSFTCWQISIKT